MSDDGNLVVRDYVIIGGGPAGVQLGYYLQQAQRDYVIVEAESSCGAFFRRHPRHRKLLSVNKLYTGCSDRERQLRWDWNSLLGPEDDVPFSAYSREYFPDAGSLARYIDDFARRHALRVLFQTRIVSISRLSHGSAGQGKGEHGHEGYELTAQDGKRIRARRLIIASGFTQPHIPTVDGIELSEPYTEMSTEPSDYIDQRVLILGKGNSAFETADSLVSTARSIHLVSPQPVEFAWRSHFVGHLRAVNNNLLDTYQLKIQNAVLDAHVDHIRREGSAYVARMRYVHNTEIEDLTYDRVLNCTGFRFDPSFFEADCWPEMRSCGRLPSMSASWESTNLTGVHFAGTLTQARDYKRTSSAFIHGFRYNSKALFHMLEKQDRGIAWPGQPVEPTADALSRAMLERINTSSALWQQFGFFCDVVQIHREGGATYLQELPLEYALEHPEIYGSECFAVTLEYGKNKLTDPFNQAGRVVRTDVGHADDSAFLHPVVRHYRAGELKATHHVIEDLASEWIEPEHVNPLRAFVGEQLGVAIPLVSDIRELHGARRGRAKSKVG